MSGYPRTKEAREREKQADLIWFEYETRLRSLIEELLEPTLRRSREEREMFELLSKKNDQIIKRIDDLEFMSQRTQKRQAAFEDIFKKIHDIDTNRKAENKVLTDRIEVIKKTLEEQKTDMFILKGSMEEQERKGQRLSDDFISTRDQLADYKTYLFKIVDDLTKSSKAQSDEQRRINTESLSQLSQLNDKAIEMRENIKGHNNQLDAIRKNIEELTTRSKDLQEKVNAHDIVLADNSSKMSFVEGLKKKMEAFEQQLRIDEQYIEKYIPLYTQVQIADTLNESLHPGDRKRHSAFEKKKIQELIDSLKEANVPNFTRKMEKYYEIIDPAMKRYIEASALEKKPSNHVETAGQTEGEKKEEEIEEFYFEITDPRGVEKILERLNKIEKEANSNYQSTRAEFARKFTMLSREQAEMLENMESKLKRIPSEIEKIIEDKEIKEAQSKGLEPHISEAKLSEKSRSSTVLGEKANAFFRSISEVVVVAVDTVNGLIAHLLREERDRYPEENMATYFEDNDKPQLYSQMLREVGQKKKAPEKPEKFKKSVEGLYSQGTKDEFSVDSPMNPREGKLVQPEAVSKLDLLMMMFENFKPCLVFSMRFKAFSDFAHFLESETSRFINLDRAMRKDGSDTLQKQVIGEDKVPQSKPRGFSRGNSISNKSSMGEIITGASYDKKAGMNTSLSKG